MGRFLVLLGCVLWDDERVPGTFSSSGESNFSEVFDLSDWKSAHNLHLRPAQKVGGRKTRLCAAKWAQNEVMRAFGAHKLHLRPKICAQPPFATIDFLGWSQNAILCSGVSRIPLRCLTHCCSSHTLVSNQPPSPYLLGSPQGDAGKVPGTNVACRHLSGRMRTAAMPHWCPGTFSASPQTGLCASLPFRTAHWV